VVDRIGIPVLMSLPQRSERRNDMTHSSKDDARIVAEVSAAILELYPSATRFGVSSADQDDYGFWLIDVGFDDDVVITQDSGTFAELVEKLHHHFRSLSWGVFGDHNDDADFDVDIRTGRIIR
jgi:hypothetical protein